ncbi:unnamed protein product, partial [Effrenium voratum]
AEGRGPGVLRALGAAAGHLVRGPKTQQQRRVGAPVRPSGDGSHGRPHEPKRGPGVG